MKPDLARSTRFLALGALLAFLLSPSAAGATELLAQTTASKRVPGESSPIDIFVLVTQRGNPVSDLGADVGNGTGPITLPTGWTLTLFPFTTGIVGCAPEPPGPAVFPGRFRNHGNGVYEITVQIATNCQWNIFVLYYAVQIDIGSLRGSGLGHFFPLSGP